MATLLIKSGKLKGKKLIIADGLEVIIGREPQCTLCLNAPEVSRKHCVVRSTDSALFVRDLGSRTGTLVNDVRIDSEIQLKLGDELVVGPFVFEIAASGAPATTKAPASAQRASGEAAPIDDDDASDDSGTVLQSENDSPAEAPPDAEDGEDAVLDWLSDGAQAGGAAHSPRAGRRGDQRRRTASSGQDSDDELESFELSLDTADDLTAVDTSAEHTAADSQAAVAVADQKHYESTRDIAADILRGDFKRPEPVKAKKAKPQEEGPKTLSQRLRENPRWVAAGAAVLLLAVYWFWPTGAEDRAAYRTLNSLYLQYQKNIQENVGQTRMREFRKEAEETLKPLAAKLEKTASSKQPLKQELLYIARDWFPRLLREETFAGLDPKTELERHLAMAKEMIDGANPRDVLLKYEPPPVPPADPDAVPPTE